MLSLAINVRSRAIWASISSFVVAVRNRKPGCGVAGAAGSARAVDGCSITAPEDDARFGAGRVIRRISSARLSLGPPVWVGGKAMIVILDFDEAILPVSPQKASVSRQRPPITVFKASIA
jgi:hypothetical protein